MYDDLYQSVTWNAVRKIWYLNYKNKFYGVYFVMKYNKKYRIIIVLILLAGYQRELRYQHDDGPFSAFGNSDPAGSTW